MSDRVTHAQNQFAHPGLPDVNSQRRTHDEVLADAKIVAERKEAEREARAVKEAKLKSFEDKACRAATRTDSDANRPPPASQMKVPHLPAPRLTRKDALAAAHAGDAEGEPVFDFERGGPSDCSRRRDGRCYTCAG